MAAEKRTEYGPLVPGSLYDADVDRFTSYTELPGGSHDGANVPGSSSQLQPESSQTAEHEPFPPLEPSVPAEDTNNLPTRDRTAAFNSARGSLPRNSHGTSRHGSVSSRSTRPVPLAPENTRSSGVTRSTATAVEEPPAENLDAVEIRAAKDNHDPRRGVCARINMDAGRQIIHETPLFSCDKPRWLWGAHQSIALAWTTLNGQTRDELQAEFAGMLGLSTRAGLSKTQRQQLEGFVKEYASADTGGRRVHIHRIASHINHACGRCANAKASIDSADPNSISVTLLRSVSTGEQILIKYKKPNAPCFVCGTRRMWTFMRSENQRRDTHVNTPQQPPETEQHPTQEQQQPPANQQQPPEYGDASQGEGEDAPQGQGEDASQVQQQPQTRGQRFIQRARKLGQWIGVPDGDPFPPGEIMRWGL